MFLGVSGRGSYKYNKLLTLKFIGFYNPLDKRLACGPAFNFLGQFIGSQIFGLAIFNLLNYVNNACQQTFKLGKAKVSDQNYMHTQIFWYYRPFGRATPFIQLSLSYYWAVFLFSLAVIEEEEGWGIIPALRYGSERKLKARV